MIIYDSTLKIFYSSLINDNDYFSGFGTKQLGDGKKQIENIFKFLNSNNIRYSQIVIPEQIHSTNIDIFVVKTRDKLEKIEDTDGVITNEKGVVLTVMTADCVPIVFADKKNGVIGISHQGWRGSIKRMSQKMIDKIIEVGGRIENIKAGIGPSIGDCCYDIDDDRYYQFFEEFNGYSQHIFYRRSGKWHLNLAKLNYLLLLEKGVRKENIDFFPFCTKCDKKRFFSFRRDKKLIEGEMFSFILKN